MNADNIIKHNNIIEIYEQQILLIFDKTKIKQRLHKEKNTNDYILTFIRGACNNIKFNNTKFRVGCYKNPKHKVHFIQKVPIDTIQRLLNIFY